MQDVGNTTGCVPADKIQPERSQNCNSNKQELTICWICVTKKTAFVFNMNHQNMLSSYPNLRQLWKAASKLCMHPTWGWSVDNRRGIFNIGHREISFGCRMNETVKATWDQTFLFPLFGGFPQCQPCYSILGTLLISCLLFLEIDHHCSDWLQI